MKKIIVQFNLPGVTANQYEAVWNDLRAAGFPNPDGLIYHVAAQNGNNWLVVDIWESEQKFSKFGETLMPILAKNNVPTDVPPTVLPVHAEYGVAVETDVL